MIKRNAIIRSNPQLLAVVFVKRVGIVVVNRGLVSFDVVEVAEAVPVETAQSAACSEPEKAFVILNDATDGVAGKSVTYFIL